MPESGRLGRVANIRELVITGTPYFLPPPLARKGINIARDYGLPERFPLSVLTASSTLRKI
jgi:hypothetical protein